LSDELWIAEPGAGANRAEPLGLALGSLVCSHQFSGRSAWTLAVFDMSRRFQVTLHGTGFSVPVADGDTIRGFYTIRRVLADSPQDAGRKAIATLQQEERYCGLVETTERELGSRDGCRVRLDSIGQLSWFRWHISRHSPSFIFYSDEKDG